MMVKLQYEAPFLVLREDARLEDVSDDVFQAWASFRPGLVDRGGIPWHQDGVRSSVTSGR